MLRSVTKKSRAEPRMCNGGKENIMNIVPITTETIAPYLPLYGDDIMFLRAPGRYALGAQESGKEPAADRRHAFRTGSNSERRIKTCYIPLTVIL